MASPGVDLSELDGALGIIPPSIGDIMAIVGPASDGPFNTPAAFARTTDVQSNFKSGPLVEAAAYAIERYGKPVVLVRPSASVAGIYSSLGGVIDGTATVAPAAATESDDELEIYLYFPQGGTVGTAGIEYQWSINNGRTLSPALELGTANSIVVPESGGVMVNLGTGDINANNYRTFRALPAQPSDAELSLALTALRNTKLRWDFVQLASVVDSSAAVTIDAEMVAMQNAGKYRWAVANVRSPDVGETAQQYHDALAGDFGNISSRHLMLCAGYCKQHSSINARIYRRPIAPAVAARASRVTAQIDLAEIDLGALPGVQIRDGNGNPDEHDETVFPGLDDLRFTTLRSWEEREGAFVNNPKLLSPTGSDFVYAQHRRVMNVASAAVRSELARITSKGVLVNKKTGFILEEEARRIEKTVEAVLRTRVLKRGFASAATFVLSRTDNILSTQTLNGSCRVVPLGYVKFIKVPIGFYNPAFAVTPIAA